MTNKPETCDNSVIRPSVMPSMKYPCFGSSLILANGSTAIDGLSGSGNAIRPIDAGSILDAHGRHQAAEPAPSTRKMAAAAIIGDGPSLEPVVGLPSVLPAITESSRTR